MLVPIPDLAAARRVLCVQPHYDDNDIGAGGTLAGLSAAGAEIVYVTATDDLLGIRDEVDPEHARVRLKQEQDRAGREIGVSSQVWLDFPDGGEYDYFALRRALVREIRRVRPDFVVTCDPWMPYEVHTDHLQVGRAAAEAVLFQRFARFHTDPEVDAAYQPYGLAGIAFYFTARPNVVFDIDGSRERKHRALDAYVSQIPDGERTLLHLALDVKEREWAKAAQPAECAGEHGFTHGEALKVLSPIHLHVSPDAEEISSPTAGALLACRPAPAS